MFYRSKLSEKLKEALEAVLPILGIVLVLSFTVAPVPLNQMLVAFYIVTFVLAAFVPREFLAVAFRSDKHAANDSFTLAAEKEMIFVVVKSAQKNDIMSAIMKHAGMESKAKAICFTLPVSATAGLRLVEDD